MPTIPLTCPHCSHTSSVENPEGFHVEGAFCGECEKTFTCKTTLWQLLGDENISYEGAIGFYYLPPKEELSVEKSQKTTPEAAPLSNQAWLGTLPLRYVLAAYRSRGQR